MPAGQFKTRRNPETGQLESIPEPESARLEASAAVAESDAAFLQDFMDRDTEDPLPPDEAEEMPDVDPGVDKAVAGAVAGAKVGGVPGAVLGGAVGFLLAQAQKTRPRPIGTLEGGQVSGEDDIGRNIRTLLDVQQRIAKIGTPIKDAVTTQPANSRL